MSYCIQAILIDEARTLITGYDSYAKQDPKALDEVLAKTTHLWLGKSGEQPITIWGLCVATLLSDSAYLWHIMLSQNRFALAKNSKRQIAEMLASYPTLHGHCETGAASSARWLRWLGAKLGEAQGPLTPFTIQRASDG